MYIAYPDLRQETRLCYSGYSSFWFLTAADKLHTQSHKDIQQNKHDAYNRAFNTNWLETE